MPVVTLYWLILYGKARNLVEQPVNDLKKPVFRREAINYIFELVAISAFACMMKATPNRPVCESPSFVLMDKLRVGCINFRPRLSAASPSKSPTQLIWSGRWEKVKTLNHFGCREVLNMGFQVDQSIFNFSSQFRKIYRVVTVHRGNEIPGFEKLGGRRNTKNG